MPYLGTYQDNEAILTGWPISHSDTSALPPALMYANSLCNSYERNARNAQKRGVRLLVLAGSKTKIGGLGAFDRDDRHYTDITLAFAVSSGGIMYMLVTQRNNLT